jgi:hypothetical protein
MKLLLINSNVAVSFLLATMVLIALSMSLWSPSPSSSPRGGAVEIGALTMPDRHQGLYL